MVVIDTERGRASLYGDNRKVLSALPSGFDVLELDAPYHPKRYIEAIDAVEAAGYKVCLIDSASDAWDGPGGCTDIAEANKNMWTIPKLWNKRLMSRMQTSTMHIICLLKAQEKTKIIDKAKSASGKQEYIDLGVLPICEKGFFYPMLLGFSVDPKTHVSTVVKYHDDLYEMFSTPHLITKVDGENLNRWNATGSASDPNERLFARAKSEAEQGTKAYAAFFGSLTVEQKKALAGPAHDENKRIAADADFCAREDASTEEKASPA